MLAGLMLGAYSGRRRGPPRHHAIEPQDYGRELRAEGRDIRKRVDEFMRLGRIFFPPSYNAEIDFRVHGEEILRMYDLLNELTEIGAQLHAEGRKVIVVPPRESGKFFGYISKLMEQFGYYGGTTLKQALRMFEGDREYAHIFVRLWAKVRERGVASAHRAFVNRGLPRNTSVLLNIVAEP